MPHRLAENHLGLDCASCALRSGSAILSSCLFLRFSFEPVIRKIQDYFECSFACTLILLKSQDDDLYSLGDEEWTRNQIVGAGSSRLQRKAMCKT
mmetsp:Transcript_5391/g.17479  ORF Transcript_5391/g.17479 Transcript_5391/m.17479 type:complete len:95 (+) Transcript_5391:97-381(+)